MDDFIFVASQCIMLILKFKIFERQAASGQIVEVISILIRPIPHLYAKVT